MCLKALEDARKCQTLAERCEAIDRVSQKLNEKAVTLWSLKGMVPRARYLCIQKGFYSTRSNDVLGLEDMIAEALAAWDRGNRDEFQSVMKQVTSYIENFRD